MFRCDPVGFTDVTPLALRIDQRREKFDGNNVLVQPQCLKKRLDIQPFPRRMVLEYAKVPVEPIHVDGAALFRLGRWVGFGHKAVKGGSKIIKIGLAFQPQKADMYYNFSQLRLGDPKGLPYFLPTRTVVGRSRISFQFRFLPRKGTTKLPSLSFGPMMAAPSWKSSSPLHFSANQRTAPPAGAFPKCKGIRQSGEPLHRPALPCLPRRLVRRKRADRDTISVIRQRRYNRPFRMSNRFAHFFVGRHLATCAGIANCPPAVRHARFSRFRDSGKSKLTPYKLPSLPWWWRHWPQFCEGINARGQTVVLPNARRK